MEMIELAKSIAELKELTEQVWWFAAAACILILLK